MRACHCAFSSRGASTRPTAACSRPTAPNSSTFEPIDWKSTVAADRAAHVSGGVPPVLSFCDSKAWLLDHMPAFDLHFLPGSVAVNGTSMLDDNIAFVLMADRAAPWSASIPMEIKFSYLLPYASYHESRAPPPPAAWRRPRAATLSIRHARRPELEATLFRQVFWPCG